jgi:uncharacterized protein (TIGR02231 family)
MKNTIVVLFLLLFASAIHSENIIRVDSKVDHVTVYRSGALVSRLATTNLSPGQYVLQFSGLSPLLDMNSIQIIAGDQIRMLSISHELTSMESEQPAALLMLLDKKDRYLDSINQVDAKWAVLKEEVQLLAENRAVNENSNNQLNDLKALSAYYRKRMTEIKIEEIQIQKELTKLKKGLKKVEAEIEDFYRSIRGRKTSTVSIVADILSTQDIDLALNYLVNNASWSTSYDVHVDDISKPLLLTNKGNISNRTQEIWTNASLTLSTGNPRRHSHLPVLQPWWLRFENPIVYQKSRVDDMANVREAEEHVLDGVRVESAYMATAEENLTTLEFHLPKRMTISADGHPHTVVLDQNEVDAIYRYHCVPKIDLAAYLTARIPDWESMNLSAGQANLFLENSFVGRTYINPASVSDTLDLSLGVDVGVIIERTKTRSMEEDAALSSKRTRHTTYTISVKNNKSKPIDIMVSDQFPLSTDDDIEITRGKTSGAAVDKDNGIIKWDFIVDNGQSKELTFDYSVRYPKKKTLWLP